MATITMLDLRGPACRLHPLDGRDLDGLQKGDTVILTPDLDLVCVYNHTDRGEPAAARIVDSRTGKRHGRVVWRA